MSPTERGIRQSQKWAFQFATTLHKRTSFVLVILRFPQFRQIPPDILGNFRDLKRHPGLATEFLLQSRRKRQQKVYRRRRLNKLDHALWPVP